MAKELAAVGYEHHEADQYFEQEGTYRFNPDLLDEAHDWCLAQTIDSLMRGADCVVANTFTRQLEMAPYMEAAICYGATLHILEARGNWPNSHGVPQETINRMRERWEYIDYDALCTTEYTASNG